MHIHACTLLVCRSDAVTLAITLLITGLDGAPGTPARPHIFKFVWCEFLDTIAILHRPNILWNTLSRYIIRLN